MTRRTHRDAESRSLALHVAVARKLRERPESLEEARARVRGWLATGSVHRYWAEAWANLLAGSLGEVIAAITDPGERACDLRQSSPFAGALDPRERWAILDRVSKEATSG